MPYNTVVFERDYPLAIITLNRPERINALNAEMGDELLAVVQECAADPGIRAVLLTGAGRGFCSGGDQKREQSPSENPEAAKAMVTQAHNVIKAIRNLPKPVIAAVHGAAAGAGLNLALVCDLRVAAENAKLNLAFVKVGLSPDTGGSYWLPRLVGLTKATELIFTGDTIDAREAERLGIVNKVVPDDQLMTEARSLALRLANGPTLALGRAKMLLNRSLQNELATHLDMEREMLGLGYQSADYREGVAAFREKRAPQFKGQ